MRSLAASRTDRLHAALLPALASFAAECWGTLVRLLAYMGSLALLALVGLQLWSHLATGATGPAGAGTWGVADRSTPAFAVSHSDLYGKTEAYEILRHPEGGRKDILRWLDLDNRPVAELEVYRPGREWDRSVSATGVLADRMEPGAELETAGMVDSKFGAVTLLRASGAAVGPDHARSCLGFLRKFDQPDLQISGWSCGQSPWPVRRAAIGCLLDRLVLLAAAGEPKLAAWFAAAELRPRRCSNGGGAELATDWVSSPENVRLRGAL